jgi:hypothetical protein
MLTYKNHKAKPCEVCPRLFVPERMGQKVCSPACAMKKVRQEKVEERAKVRTRKEAIKTIPELIKEAQRAFNAFIRARDHLQPCISCDANPPDLTALHAGRDAGHYRSTGSASHLRFHEDNCHAQCVKCNQWGAGMAVDYRMRLIERIGAARVEALESNNTPHKWTREELIAIRDTYRAKLKEMRK